MDPAKRALAVLVAAVVAHGACGDLPERELGSSFYPITAAVEQWRKLVEKYFKYQHVTWALNIMQCESGGNPNAYNSSSGASGLFQHLAKYWPPRATAAGFPGASPFNGEANIAASAWLLYKSGPGQWSCKYSPYENFNYQPVHYKDGVAVPPPNQPPKGYLDGVDGACLLKGWAQDPDAPSAALEVHVYIDGAAGSGAKGWSGIKANVNRPDLCSAIGSCNHGFEWAVPAEFRDGKAHKAWAYSFDSASGAPQMLQDSPKSFTCAAPPEPPPPSPPPASSPDSGARADAGVAPPPAPDAGAIDPPPVPPSDWGVPPPAEEAGEAAAPAGGTLVAGCAVAPGADAGLAFPALLLGLAVLLRRIGRRAPCMQDAVRESQEPGVRRLSTTSARRRSRAAPRTELLDAIGRHEK